MRDGSRPDGTRPGWRGNERHAAAALLEHNQMFEVDIDTSLRSVRHGCRSCCGDEIDLVDGLVGGRALRQRFVTRDEPVAQAIMHHRTHMIGHNEFLAVEPGAHAGTEVQRETAARACADLQPFAERLAALDTGKRVAKTTSTIYFCARSDTKILSSLRARVEDRLLRHGGGLGCGGFWVLRILLCGNL